MTWQDLAGAPWPAPAGGPAQPGRLAAGARRRIAPPPVAVRPVLLRTIRELAFELRTEQLSLLEATRGSKLGAMTMVAAKLPLDLRVMFEPDGAGTVVSVALVDRWPARVGRNWGATTAYVEAFGAVLSTVDGALARLDPAAAAAFEPWWRDTGPGDVAVMRNVAGITGRANAVLSRHTSRVLDGSPEQRGAAVSNSGAPALTFAAPESVAEVATDVADAMLMVGTLIASRPGALPPALAAQVQAFVYRAEEHISRSAADRFRLTVDAAEVPVITFLHQQAGMRAKLAVRTLRICTTCRLEKVTNPDLERIQERSRRRGDLATGLTAVVSPFVAAGRLVQMNAKGPTFTCPRCQGLDADETVITYCQRCGERQTETALRTCGKCSFDFRSLVDPAPLWHAPDASPPAVQGTPAVEEVPAPMTAAAPPAPWAPGPPSAPPPAAPWAPPPPPAAPVHGEDASNWPRPPV